MREEYEGVRVEDEWEPLDPGHLTLDTTLDHNPPILHQRLIREGGIWRADETPPAQPRQPIACLFDEGG